MNKTRIVLDSGSTHMGKMEYCKELIHVAAESGADAVKFQLFVDAPEYTKGGNIALNRDWFQELVEWGKYKDIEVFASAFDSAAIELISKHCTSIKFSHSVVNETRSDVQKKQSSKLVQEGLEKSHKRTGRIFSKIYLSGNIFTTFPTDERVVKLYCIPEYPVKYLINFSGLFPRFDGFSDHSIGFMQSAEASYEGAKYIEKHFRLDHFDCGNVPDGRFALYPKEVEKLCRIINK